MLTYWSSKNRYPVTLCYQLIDSIIQDNEHSCFIPFLSVVQFYKVIYNQLKASERYFPHTSAELLFLDYTQCCMYTYNIIFLLRAF